MPDSGELSAGLSVEQRALLALRRLRAKVAELEGEKTEPIAILGMGCRFPKGANSPEAFWRLLQDGVDAISEVPAERWDAKAFFDLDPSAPGKMNTQWGGFLAEVDRFDPYFFGISPREANGMDPQRRLWLEVVWEAIENAGQTLERLTGSQTGVFAGVYNSDYSWMQLDHPDRIDTYSASGSPHSLIANHLSYLLDLKGPSLAIDTACSSSLVAVHLACQSLRSRECRLAIAGGVNLMVSPWSTVAVSKVLAMAADGRCKTFDARADGIVRGEGCGVIVLKRLSDALADGDPVVAVIRGSAVNQDGRSAALTAPNVLAQQAVLRQALANAGVAPEKIGLIEAHGTGTTLGDPIEVEALTAVVGQPRADGQSCALGSVKTNLGHLEAAAGIAGLIKAALALQHGTIPAHLHLRTLNPNISLEHTAFVIPAASVPWPARAEPRYAGVSSFGIGGTNAHVVLEEAPNKPTGGPAADTGVHPGVRPTFVLPISARSPEALRSLAASYRTLLLDPQEPAALADICYTAGVRRSHHLHRLAVVGRSREEIAESLTDVTTGTKGPGARPGLVFVFSGQGAHRIGMGRELLAAEPVFREAVAECDALLLEYGGWSILDELLVEPPRLENTEVAQPLLLALQLGLAALWRSWGIVPDAVIGHSVGEVAAACVAGVLSVRDAIHIAWNRGRLMQRAHGQGAMAAVALGPEDVSNALKGYEERVTIAVVNSPTSVVLSGEPEALVVLIDSLQQQGVRCKKLPVAYAFHSPQMAPLQAELERSLAGLKPQAGTTPMVSTVTGRACRGESCDAAYWSRNMREPVQFARAVETLAGDGHSIFLEIGAHPVLSADIAECLSASAQEGTALASLRRDRGEVAALLGSLARLYTLGYPLDWRRLYPAGGRFVMLPNYPWQRERYWLDAAQPVTTASLTQEASLLVQRLRSTPASERQSLLLRHLREQAGQILGLEAARLVDPRQPLNELGLDSMMAVELRNALSVALGRPLPATLLFDYPTLETLAGHLAGEVRELAPAVIEALPGEPIAIIGMACRFPGGISDPESLWRALRAGTDFITEVPRSRWDVDAYYDSDPDAPGKMTTRWGGFLRDVDQFDPQFFGISPREALNMDPQQRLLLEVSWEALERAGQAPDRLDGSKTGVFVGPGSNEYGQFQLSQGAAALDPYWGTGNSASVTAGRISYALGLRGPSLSVDTACSSSLVAVHLACQSLRSGESDLALAGGVNLMLAPEGTIYLSRMRAVAPDGHCKTFDAAADGYVRGEACGMVVLKRLSEAQTAGDPILAVIRGSAVNHDGRSGGLTAPNGPSQQAVIRAALAQARVEPAQVSYVEAHGTGTPLGDPIELQALAAVLGVGRDAGQKVSVGSIKTNIGHTEAAAGIAGLIKVVLAMQHAEIPPHLHFHAPNPHVAWEELAVSVPTELTPWPAGGNPRIAGISAFGFSGTNAHVVLEEAPAAQAAARAETGESRMHVLPLSARHPRALEALVKAYRETLLTCGEAALYDLCYTASLGRSHHSHRLAVVGRTAAELARQLSAPHLPADSVEADLARAYSSGEDVNWESLYPSGGQRVLLPTYPWQNSRYWMERRSDAEPSLSSEGWTYKTEWQSRPCDSPRRPEQPGSWLIFSDRGGVGQALAERLEALGERCHLIFPSAEYRCRSDFERLLRETLGSDAPPCRGVVHLWSLIPPPPDLDAGALTEMQHLVCGSALNLVQTLPASRLWLVTRGAQPVTTTLTAPEQSPLWGLAHAVAVEHPMLRCVCIDLDPMGNSDELLWTELWADGRENQVGFRGALRYTARLVRSDVGQVVNLRRVANPLARPIDNRPQVNNLPHIGACNAEATYLITGGLGGLGLRVARWMVEQGARVLVLAARREPSQEARIAIEEMERAGARVIVKQADVSSTTEADRLLSELAESLPPLRGIMHAAGTADDGLLQNQNWDRFAGVLAPKVAGAWNLHLLTKDQPLDFFVLFSSAASILTGPGQGTYAAANAFLDGLAHYRKSQNLPALSVNWGPWAGVGLAAAGGRAAERRWASSGVGTIPPQQGPEILGRVLAETQVAVIPLDWATLFGTFAAGDEPAFFDEMAQEAKASKAAQQGPEPRSELLNQLQLAAPPARENILAAFMREQAIKVLGLDPDYPLDLQKPLAELGLDSLMAIELRNALSQALGQPLPVTLLFNYPTLAALAGHLATEFLKFDSPAKPKETPAALTNRPSEPIALAGMGCRFPGGVRDPEAFWRLLHDGVDAITEVPPSRWDAAALYDPNPDAPGKMSTRWGGFLDGVDQFDPHFFGIAPREAVSMDPQQRLLLEVCWEALENAGQRPANLVGSRTGVFVGMSASDYGQLHTVSANANDVDPYWGTGSAASVAAGRISYVLGLQGPSMAVDTACSSSLVAIHLACQSLRNGECDLALACGVNLILTPEVTIYMSKLHALAADGRCKTFDTSADGMVRSEGCGAVVLKRLSDAVAAGDPVVAVIRGTAVNQDGRSSGLTAPNGPAQEAVIRSALAQAGVAPAEIQYVEAHGTGTELGDPIEVQALCAVLDEGRGKDQPLIVGSVKTNIGHTEAAAGIAGVMKVALALQHQEIPPHLHFHTLNPHIPLNGTPLVIPAEARPWGSGVSQRYAGVSSFGFSGTNAHAVMEEAPRSGESSAMPPDGRDYLLPLSARSPAALRSLAEIYLAQCNQELLGGEAHDVCYTASVRRSHHIHRLAAVGKTTADITQCLEAFLRGEPHAGLSAGAVIAGIAPSPVFVFPGHGAQWHGMARDVLAAEPVFLAALEQCAEALRVEVPWNLLDVIREGEPAWAPIDILQPVTFAVQVALAALWRSWGVEPAAVVGHSMGEVAAAYVAGAIDLKDASRIICARSALLKRVSGHGAMALVDLTLDETQEMINGYGDRLVIAVTNGPRAPVISGDPGAVRTVAGDLEKRGVFCRMVKTDVAFHSPQMDPLLEELSEALFGIQPRTASVPFYSSVNAAVCHGPELNSLYWARNLREPVRFWGAMERLLNQGENLFLELSPHLSLAHAIRDGARSLSKDATVLPSLRRDESGRAVLLNSLGSLYCEGVPLEWKGLYPAGGRVVQLPAYPWQREHYWLDLSKTSKRKLGPREGHPLLGPGWKSSAHADTYFWETELSRDTLPWLDDHRVRQTVVLPATAYMDMALAASAQAFGSGRHSIEGLTLQQALMLPEEGAVTVQTVLALGPSGMANFRCSSRAVGVAASGAPWTLHVSGAVRFDLADAVVTPPEQSTLEEIKSRCTTPISARDFYPAFAAQGLQYGPAFQGVTQIWRRDNEALASLQVSPAVTTEAAAYQIHPALLDSALQLAGAAVPEDLLAAAGGATYVPVSVSSLRVFGPPASVAWSHVVNSWVSGVVNSDVFLLNAEGQVLVEVRGLVAQRLETDSPVAKTAGSEDLFYALQWLPQARASAAEGSVRGKWLFFTDGSETAAGLAQRLETSGGTCLQVFPSQINPSRPEEFQQLLRDAFAAGESCRGVIHMWSALAKDLETAEAWGVRSILHLVQALVQMGWRDAPRLWLLTRGAQAAGAAGQPVAVEQTPVWGLGRTLALEHAEFRSTLIDLSTEEPPQELVLLAEELLADDIETQLLLRGDARYVARMVRWPPALEESVPQAIIRAADASFRLEIDKPGVLDHLTLRASRRAKPGPGEVEIRVEAAALNFNDVLKAMGLYPDLPPGHVPLGGECAGTIVALGEGAEGLEIGQEVIGLTAGSFATHVITAAPLVAPKPSHLSMEEATTLPVACMTVAYSLRHLAQLAAGESVLIHAAAGGVGLAAIQYAQRVGAEIFATAGTPEKRELLKSLGVQHVMDSRSLAFADQVMDLTQGKGVDVVLNSLAGDAMLKSLEVTAPFGRFLELGKRDLYSNRQVGLWPLRKGVSYLVVDVAGLAPARPAVFGAVWRKVVQEINAGVWKAISHEVFPIAESASAFRKMAQGKHTGKIVLSLKSKEESMIARAPDASIDFTASGTYLITGGLGALGLTVAEWLVEQGVRHVALMGRRGPSAEAQAAIVRLEQAGAQVMAARADVAEAAEVGQVLRDIEQNMPPLRGVIHAAGVLDDGLLMRLEQERFKKVMAPKVAGAWNLHTLTAKHKLDCFVMFSSAASLLGSPGQGNYAAGNAFLDGLAHYRRALGLPGLSINWGPFAEIGLAATEHRGGRLAMRGIASLTPAQGMEALGRLMRAPATQVGVLALNLRQWREFYPKASDAPLLSILLENQDGEVRAHDRENAVRKALLEAEPEQRLALIEAQLKEQLGQVLRVAPARIDRLTPLPTMGLDSLMALELRNRLESSFGLSLGATLVWNYPTIAVLVPHLAEKMGVSLSGVVGTLGVETEEASDEALLAILGEVDKVSEDDLRRMLVPQGTHQ